MAAAATGSTTSKPPAPAPASGSVTTARVWSASAAAVSRRLQRLSSAAAHMLPSSWQLQKWPRDASEYSLLSAHLHWCTASVGCAGTHPRITKPMQQGFPHRIPACHWCSTAVHGHCASGHTLGQVVQVFGPCLLCFVHLKMNVCK
jgi:hypothetical protein